MANELKAKLVLGTPRQLIECPIGLFMCNGELCVRTEYMRPDGSVEAYIVETGEAYWGPRPQSVESQRSSTVTPVNLEIDNAN